MKTINRFPCNMLIVSFGILLYCGVGVFASSMLKVDYAKLAGRADLTYNQMTPRSEAGLPVGNGVMGSLVWMTPESLKFQINRVDVYANNSHTNSFARRDRDYCGGCGFVDIDFVNFGDDVFTEKNTKQHLSAYDGVVTIEGGGIKARIIACPDKDVIAIEITDSRSEPSVITTRLNMLRFMTEFWPEFKKNRPDPYASQYIHANHKAFSKLHQKDGKILLTQEFTEDEYFCGSAVAIDVIGRKTKSRLSETGQASISAEAGNGSFVILISSAASFDSNDNIMEKAICELDAAKKQGFVEMLKDVTSWWHDFWAGPKTFVRLHSEDGVADYVEENYNYYLYLMGLSSRGILPPKFNGMIWNTGGDMRQWASQHWWFNVGCYYRSLHPTGRFDLMDPMFNMYSDMYDSCAQAARQQWGSKGIFIQETSWFDGLAPLPEDISKEMIELYNNRKPWEERSDRFNWYASTKCPFSSRWNWKGNEAWEKGHRTFGDKGYGGYGHTMHLFNSGADVAQQYWLRYLYTEDKEWLRNRAYPMIKGVAEFYRNYPNFEKGADGKYHIYNVNCGEGIWGSKDTLLEICAMRGIFPIAARTSEILGVDEDLRQIWKEITDNLVPLPTSETPGALEPKKQGEAVVWIGGLFDTKNGIEPSSLHRPDKKARINPCINFDLCTLETKDAKLLEIANNTLDLRFANQPASQTSVRVLSRVPIAAAMLGRAEDFKYLVANQIRVIEPETDFCSYKSTGEEGVLLNRMTLREGVQAIGVERLGRAAEAIHAALVQSVSPAPAEDFVIRVFPAWPKDWDADFTLLCRGGFLVSSSMKKGRIQFVEIESQLGGECRLRNPWDGEIAIYRNGKKDRMMKGELLKFDTEKSEDIVIVKKGLSPDKLNVF